MVLKTRKNKYPVSVYVILTIIGLLWTAHMVLAAMTAQYFGRLRELDCPCATEPRGTFLFAASIAHLVLSPIVLALVLTRSLVQSVDLKQMLAGARQILSLLQMGLMVAFVASGMQYLRDIESERCACGKDDPRWKVLQAWTYLWIGQLALSILLLVMVLVLLGVVVTRFS